MTDQKTTDQKYGGYVFRGKGYHHYRYPDPGSYDFNRLLRDFRDPALRARYLDDADAVEQEFGLSPEESKALRTLDIDTCVAAGAHPLLAWTGCRFVARDREAREGVPPGTYDRTRDYAERARKAGSDRR